MITVVWSLAFLHAIPEFLRMVQLNHKFIEIKKKKIKTYQFSWMWIHFLLRTAQLGKYSNSMWRYSKWSCSIHPFFHYHGNLFRTQFSHLIQIDSSDLCEYEHYFESFFSVSKNL